MNKKTIKLLILTSIFSSFLTNQVKGQTEADNLLKDIDKTYQNFSAELKPKGKLLTKLEAEKEKSSTEITEIDTTINDDSDKLIKDLENLNQSVDDSEKKIITSLLLILKPSENKDNLGDILPLFKDNKLDKKEICDDIQKPLKVQSVTDANCGTFGNNTYTTIQQLFTEKDNEIKTNIDKLKSSLKNQDKGNDNSPSEQKTGKTDEGKSLFKEPLFIWTLINTILTLGLIGTFIWLYLFTKKIEQKTQELNKKNERRKQQIEQLKQREENRNQQINKMNDRILNLKNSLDNLSLNITNLVQTPPQINLGKTPQTTTSTQFDNPPEETPPSIPETLPENVRLSYLFKENPQSLIQNAIRVGMTKETLNKVISGTWEGVVELEASRQGEYYIVASNSGESYLFLDPNTTFNVPTLQNINKSQLFICHGDISQSFKGNDINITKPATVIKDNQNWRLMESGEIQFN